MLQWKLLSELHQKHRKWLLDKKHISEAIHFLLIAKMPQKCWLTIPTSIRVITIPQCWLRHIQRKSAFHDNWAINQASSK